MNKKHIIIISIVVVLVVVILIFRFNQNKNIQEITETNIKSNVTQASFDENTGYYCIRDGETGVIRTASKDESELKIYIDNPDYNPNPLVEETTTDLEEFILKNSAESSPAEELVEIEE